MSIGPDYESALRKAWAKNIEDCWNNPLKRFNDVGAKFASRRGVSEELIRHWLCTEQGAALHFAVDPLKQTFHQKTAASWIENLPGISIDGTFNVLPGSGKNAEYVSDGSIVSGENLPNRDGKKSIDFVWQINLRKCPPLLFYASHKYTNESGGAQDNQFNDIYAFTKEAVGLKRELNKRILAIVDGDFYKGIRQNSKVSRSEELKQLVGANLFVAAIESADLPAYLAAQIELHIAQTGRILVMDELDLIAKLKNYP